MPIEHEKSSTDVLPRAMIAKAFGQDQICLQTLGVLDSNNYVYQAIQIVLSIYQAPLRDCFNEYEAAIHAYDAKRKEWVTPFQSLTNLGVVPFKKSEELISSAITLVRLANYFSESDGDHDISEQTLLSEWVHAYTILAKIYGIEDRWTQKFETQAGEVDRSIVDISIKHHGEKIKANYNTYELARKAMMNEVQKADWSKGIYVQVIPMLSRVKSNVEPGDVASMLEKIFSSYNLGNPWW